MMRESGDGVRPTSSAFTDRRFKPSVDREILCRHLGGATWTQAGEENGVYEFRASAARLSIPKHVPNKQTIEQVFETDVLHVPIKDQPPERDNPAHSEIHTLPQCSRSFFDKVCIALAGMPGKWAMLPRSARSTGR
jgi:hypothetical protein